jgi:hypothetical protein
MASVDQPPMTLLSELRGNRGGQGGTTSLYRYLRAHPDIDMSETKELNFFADRLWHPRPRLVRAVAARGKRGQRGRRGVLPVRAPFLGGRRRPEDELGDPRREAGLSRSASPRAAALALLHHFHRPRRRDWSLDEAVSQVPVLVAGSLYAFQLEHYVARYPRGADPRCSSPSSRARCRTARAGGRRTGSGNGRWRRRERASAAPGGGSSPSVPLREAAADRLQRLRVRARAEAVVEPREGRSPPVRLAPSPTRARSGTGTTARAVAAGLDEGPLHSRSRT